MSRVLAIGDVHAPITHPGYMQFCIDLYESWNCDRVVFIGDLIDLHGISFHAAHPMCPGPDDEYKLAKAQVQRWRKWFDPKGKLAPTDVTVMIGNHDARCLRLAETMKIPHYLLRDYADVWDTPNWQWRDDDCLIDDVYYFHGEGFSGMNPAFNAMRKSIHRSTVCGHTHTAGGIKWDVGPFTRMFGMDTGCGIDRVTWAAAYARRNKRHPVLSAGVVIDGHPYHEMMPCSTGERYNRRNFE